jgi:hypothetical protein
MKVTLSQYEDIAGNGTVGSINYDLGQNVQTFGEFAPCGGSRTTGASEDGWECDRRKGIITRERLRFGPGPTLARRSTFSRDSSRSVSTEAIGSGTTSARAAAAC